MTNPFIYLAQSYAAIPDSLEPLEATRLRYLADQVLSDAVLALSALAEYQRGYTASPDHDAPSLEALGALNRLFAHAIGAADEMRLLCDEVK